MKLTEHLRMTVCRYHQNGFCKYGQQCLNKHVNELCQLNLSCQNKECEKRHPRLCRSFEEFRTCKFVKCAYTHSQDGGSNNKINELKKEVDELKQHVKNLFELCHNETKSKIKKLEDEVRHLKCENKKLAQMYSMASDKSRDIPSGKVSEAVNARSNIPMSIKFRDYRTYQ